MSFNTKPIKVRARAGGAALSYESESFAPIEGSGSYSRRSARLVIEQAGQICTQASVADDAPLLVQMMMVAQLERIADALDRLAPKPTAKRKAGRS